MPRDRDPNVRRQLANTRDYEFPSLRPKQQAAPINENNPPAKPGRALRGRVADRPGQVQQAQRSGAGLALRGAVSGARDRVAGAASAAGGAISQGLDAADRFQSESGGRMLRQTVGGMANTARDRVAGAASAAGGAISQGLDAADRFQAEADRRRADLPENQPLGMQRVGSTERVPLRGTQRQRDAAAASAEEGQQRDFVQSGLRRGAIDADEVIDGVPTFTNESIRRREQDGRMSNFAELEARSRLRQAMESPSEAAERARQQPAATPEMAEQRAEQAGALRLSERNQELAATELSLRSGPQSQAASTPGQRLAQNLNPATRETIPDPQAFFDNFVAQTRDTDNAPGGFFSEDGTVNERVAVDLATIAAEFTQLQTGARRGVPFFGSKAPVAPPTSAQQTVDLMTQALSEERGKLATFFGQGASARISGSGATLEVGELSGPALTAFQNVRPVLLNNIATLSGQQQRTIARNLTNETVKELRKSATRERRIQTQQSVGEGFQGQSDGTRPGRDQFPGFAEADRLERLARTDPQAAIREILGGSDEGQATDEDQAEVDRALGRG